MNDYFLIAFVLSPDIEFYRSRALSLRKITPGECVDALMAEPEYQGMKEQLMEAQGDRSKTARLNSVIARIREPYKHEDIYHATFNGCKAKIEGLKEILETHEDVYHMVIIN